MTVKSTRDRKSGQYAHSKFEALCVCGHTLGEHTAAVVGGLRPCISGDFTGVPCACQKFKKARVAAASKNPKQLDSEIAAALPVGPQPELAAIFANPAARRVFAEEMRLELYKKKSGEESRALLVAKPFNVIRRHEGARDLLSRFATIEQARAHADKYSGWVERDGRVVYGKAA
jgi:hypothetical protein